MSLTGPRGTSRPAAVLWDMDGTLVDTERLWDVSLAELAVSLGGKLTPGTRLAMVGTDMATTMRMMFAEVGLPLQPVAVTAATEKLTCRTAELFAAEVRWLPGALDALATLHAAEIPMALVTSTPRALTELVLDTIGRHFFAATVCGDEVARPKPDPEPYLRACELLGVTPAGCVAVEDSPRGAASAQAAGTTVWVLAGEADVPPGPRRTVIGSLTGLAAALLHDPDSQSPDVADAALGSPLEHPGGSMKA